MLDPTDPTVSRHLENLQGQNLPRKEYIRQFSDILMTHYDAPDDTRSLIAIFALRNYAPKASSSEYEAVLTIISRICRENCILQDLFCSSKTALLVLNALKQYDYQKSEVKDVGDSILLLKLALGLEWNRECDDPDYQ